MKIGKYLPILFFLIHTQNSFSSDFNFSLDLSPYFTGYEACFLLWDVSGDRWVKFNEDRARARMAPCSTFKIPNSLIGLETGVISGADHVYQWDGEKRWLDEWNRDHTLRSAIQHSVVWYYQRLASEVGEERMKGYLHKMGYGNEDLSGGLTKFWLSSSLKISAEEQIQFLYRLCKSDLPFSQQSMDIVKDILVVEKNDEYILRGKTGSGKIEGPKLWGWYVGYVTRGENPYIFAGNIEAKENADGQRMKAITLSILKDMKLIE